MLPLAALTLDPENARQHRPAQVRQIARSIEAFSFNVPVLVDREGKVLAGHGRAMALKLLGRTEAPVIRLEHLTPEQARAFAIADNRLNETSSWNERLLAQHLKGLAEIDLDFSLEATGFSMGEIDLKIEGLDEEGPEAEEEEPPPLGPAVAKTGDLWTMGRHKLLCASALDAAAYPRLLGGALADMVITDPPYNVAIDGNVSNLMGGKARRRHREFASASGEMSEPEFTVFLTTACRLMAEASADRSLHYVFMDWRHAFALMAAGRSAYADLINICVWTKPGGGMGGLYRSAHELVLVFKHGRGAHRNNVQLGKFGRNRTNVWAYPGSAWARHGEEADLTRQHPTPKPVSLIADAMLDASARGDVVLDPFMGSGSTLMAAERVGRQARGMELDPLYVDLTIRRWHRMTGEEAVLEGGERFGDLEAAAEAAA
ncbi:MAG TPA: DNA methyltransferase [Caulobacteraceae bacterium]|nr:DNA methyltransferase [Caulobacteraceae bacterium]